MEECRLFCSQAIEASQHGLPSAGCGQVALSSGEGTDSQLQSWPAQPGGPQRKKLQTDTVKCTGSCAENGAKQRFPYTRGNNPYSPGQFLLRLFTTPPKASSATTTCYPTGFRKLVQGIIFLPAGKHLWLCGHLRSDSKKATGRIGQRLLGTKPKRGGGGGRTTPSGRSPKELCRTDGSVCQCTWSCTAGHRGRPRSLDLGWLLRVPGLARSISF